MSNQNSNSPAPVAAATVPTQNQNQAPTQSPVPTQSAPEVFELKIDGKPVKMTKDELIQAASLGSSAQKKFQEAAQIRKQAESVLSKLKDPKQAIQLLQDPSLGLNSDQVEAAFEEWYATQVIPKRQMTPEQREQEKLKAQLKEYQDREKEFLTNKQKEEQAKLDQQTIEQVQKEIIDVIEKFGLPKSQFTGKRIAYWMKLNIQNGLNASTDQIVAQVKKETRELVDSLVNNSDGEVLEQLLGESTSKKLRKFDLERLKAKRGIAPVAQPKEEKAEKKGKIRSSDVSRNLRDMRLGRR